MVSSLDSTELESWQELIPHRPDVLVENVLAFEKYLVLLERKDALRHLRIAPVDELDKVTYVPFPEAVYDIHPSANPEFDSTYCASSILHWSPPTRSSTTTWIRVNGS
jgi:oligopeptidase B